MPGDADTYPSAARSSFVRTPWQAGGRTWNTGSPIAMPVDAFLAGRREFRLVTEPGARESINGVASTKDLLIVSVLNNVKGSCAGTASRTTNGGSTRCPRRRWGRLVSTRHRRTRTATSSPTHHSIQPTTLYYADEAGAVKDIKRLPVMWDSSGMRVEQLEATSKDGTKIPYFIVSRDGLKAGRHEPDAAVRVRRLRGCEHAVLRHDARGWLARTRWDLYVLANIRGGGEFGPKWHRAALKENRQRVRRFHRRRGGSRPAQDHVTAAPRHHGRLATAGCSSASHADAAPRVCSTRSSSRCRCSTCSATTSCWPARAGWPSTAIPTSRGAGRTSRSGRRTRI